jgi:hypothetical protein
VKLFHVYALLPEGTKTKFIKLYAKAGSVENGHNERIVLLNVVALSGTL